VIKSLLSSYGGKYLGDSDIVLCQVPLDLSHDFVTGRQLLSRKNLAAGGWGWFWLVGGLTSLDRLGWLGLRLHSFDVV
jgi:hypothetical protein